MCFMVRCEVCGELVYAEEYHKHVKSCKPELEKVEVEAKVKAKK